MKKTISAVKYGLETLGVTPDKLFSMIESSQGYVGDDYNRWLASKIIEVAEADGVGFSQLIVKKFNILSDLSEMDNLEIREEYLAKFCELLGAEDIYTYGIVNKDSSVLESIDWGHNIDYDAENCFFTDSIEDETLKEKIKSGIFNFLLKLSMSNKIKKSDLLLDAKNRSVTIKTEGGVVLHRVCLLYDVFGNPETKFSFLAPSEFMTSLDNRDIVTELVDRFNVTGYYMSDLNPYYGEYVYCICTARGSKPRDKYISLTKCEYKDDFNVIEGSSRIFSQSNIRMVDYLKEQAKEYNDKVIVVKNNKPVGYGVGYSEALGYLCVNSDVHLSSAVCALPDDTNIVCIPITEANLKDIIAFYGAYKSNEGNGYFSDINVLMSGSSKYNDLVYNSLPLFLYDYDSGFKGYNFTDKNGNTAEIKNCFDLVNSELVKTLLSNGESYYTFEAKELIGVCKMYLEGVTDAQNKSFEDIRLLKRDDNLDNMYRSSLRKLKEYISTTYRGLLKC